MSQLKIIDVEFLDDYQLSISLSNGHGIRYDIKSKLKTARFQSLNSQDVYKNGTLLSDDTIYWGSGTELALEEVVMDLTNQIPYHI